MQSVHQFTCFEVDQRIGNKSGGVSFPGVPQHHYQKQQSRCFPPPQAAGLIKHRVLEHGPTQPRHGNQNPTTTTSTTTTTVCVLAVVGFLDSSTLAPPFQCHRAQHKHSEMTFCSLGTQGGHPGRAPREA